jgi:hypothetical protein
MFEEGDLLVCWKNPRRIKILTIGKVYKLIIKSERYSTNTIDYKIKCDDGLYKYINIKNFESIISFRERKILKLKENICLKKVKK